MEITLGLLQHGCEILVMTVLNGEDSLLSMSTTEEMAESMKEEIVK